jgi:hypothetical protein
MIDIPLDLRDRAVAETSYQAAADAAVRAVSLDPLIYPIVLNFSDLLHSN